MPATLGKHGFIPALHGFRGIAILAIIGAHAWSISALSAARAAHPDAVWLSAGLGTLFNGATLYFALISGILYTRVLRTKTWASFYRSKLTKVLLPYVLISLLLSVLGWPPGPAYGMDGGFTSGFPQTLFWNIVLGRAQTHLWYIPVLAILFLLTPALNALLLNGRRSAVLLLSLMPLVVSRSVYPELLSLQSVCYFLGAYAFGMALGERLDDAFAFIRRHLGALLGLYAAVTACNFLLFFRDYAPIGLTAPQQSVIYVQKILETLLILHVLQRHEQRIPRALHLLGTYAFSLYLLHYSFIWALNRAIIAHAAITGPGMAIAAGFAVFALSTGMCLLLSMAARRLAGRHSRMLIGS